MAEIGGFYASLKLNTDTSSFAQGISYMEKMKRANKELAQFQTRMANQKEKERKLALKREVDGWKEKKFYTDELTTSLKWLGGAALLAVGALKLLSDNWKVSQDLAQGARNLNVDPVWLKKWQAGATKAGGDSAGVSSAISVINNMVANPDIGKLDKGLVTSISGILNMKGNQDLAFSTLKKMSSEQRFETITKALQSMYNQGGDTRTNALNVANQLGPVFEKLLSYRNGAFGAVGEAGGTVMVNDKNVADAEKASASFNQIMLNLTGVWDKFASNMAATLLPALNGINEWFDKNRALLSWMTGSGGPSGNEDMDRFNAWRDLQSKKGKNAAWDMIVPDNFKKVGGVYQIDQSAPRTGAEGLGGMTQAPSNITIYIDNEKAKARKIEYGRSRQADMAVAQ